MSELTELRTSPEPHMKHFIKGLVLTSDDLLVIQLALYITYHNRVHIYYTYFITSQTYTSKLLW